MMNDETRQLEQRLQQQSLKPVPQEWRAEILAAACSSVSEERRKQVSSAGGFLPKVAPPAWLVNLFWPHPKAWAGLAAVWVIIFILNHAASDGARPTLAKKTEPPSPEMIAELRKQQRIFAELVGPREEAVADRPKDNPSRPRTRLEEFQVV